MNYSRLIQRAWQLTISYRFLWVLGMFGGLASLPASGSSQTLRWLNGSERALAQHVVTTQDIPSLPELTLGTSLTLLLFVALAVLIYLSISFRGGLVAATGNLSQGRPETFMKAWATGRAAIPKLLVLGLLYVGILFGVSAIAGLPTLALLSMNAPWLGILAAFTLGALWLASLVILSIATEYAVRGLIFRNLSPTASLLHGFFLLKSRPGPTSVFWLISMALGLGLSLASTLVLGALGLMLAAIGLVLAALNAPLLISLYALLAAALLAVTYLGTIGFTNAFVSSFWTLGYLELSSGSGK